MCSGKSLPLISIFPLDVCLSAICSKTYDSVYVGGYGGLGETGLYVFRIMSSRLSCSWEKSVGFVVICSRVVC